jgi:hypothetical protein
VTFLAVSRPPFVEILDEPDSESLGLIDTASKVTPGRAEFCEGAGAVAAIPLP